MTSDATIQAVRPFEARIWRAAFHVSAEEHCQQAECARTINHDVQNVCSCICYSCKQANAAPNGKDITASWAIYDLESGIRLAYAKDEPGARAAADRWNNGRISEKIQKKAESARYLRKLLNPGDTVYTMLRHVSRSGMQRRISCLVGEGRAVTDITFDVARVLDENIKGRSGYVQDVGITRGGCGMDMGFDLVYHLSSVLFPDGFGCIGNRCPANDHSNGDRDYTEHSTGQPHWHFGAGGYALRQRWL